MRNELFGASIYSCFINKKACSANKLEYSKIISAPLNWRTEAFPRKWRCGSNSPRKLWTKFDLADFFLVRAASLFTLRTFGAQINWRIVSGKILFDPQRFLSNKLPIHFAVTSGKGNKTFCSKTACSNWKKTSIATVRDHCLTFDSFQIRIVSRFHLPLKGRVARNV